MFKSYPNKVWKSKKKCSIYILCLIAVLLNVRLFVFTQTENRKLGLNPKFN